MCSQRYRLWSQKPFFVMAFPAGIACAEDPGEKAAKKNGFYNQKASAFVSSCIISAKGTEIIQIEPYAVRFAEAVPAESARLQRKSTFLVLLLL